MDGERAFKPTPQQRLLFELAHNFTSISNPWHRAALNDFARDLAGEPAETKDAAESRATNRGRVRSPNVGHQAGRWPARSTPSGRPAALPAFVLGVGPTEPVRQLALVDIGHAPLDRLGNL